MAVTVRDETVRSRCRSRPRQPPRTPLSLPHQQVGEGARRILGEVRALRRGPTRPRTRAAPRRPAPARAPRTSSRGSSIHSSRARHGRSAAAARARRPRPAPRAPAQGRARAEAPRASSRTGRSARSRRGASGPSTCVAQPPGPGEQLLVAWRVVEVQHRARRRAPRPAARRTCSCRTPRARRRATSRTGPQEGGSARRRAARAWTASVHGPQGTRPGCTVARGPPQVTPVVQTNIGGAAQARSAGTTEPGGGIVGAPIGIRSRHSHPIDRGSPAHDQSDAVPQDRPDRRASPPPPQAPAAGASGRPPQPTGGPDRRPAGTRPQAAAPPRGQPLLDHVHRLALAAPPTAPAPSRAPAPAWRSPRPPARTDYTDPHTGQHGRLGVRDLDLARSTARRPRHRGDRLLERAHPGRHLDPGRADAAPTPTAPTPPGT